MDTPYYRPRSAVGLSRWTDSLDLMNGCGGVGDGLGWHMFGAKCTEGRPNYINTYYERSMGRSISVLRVRWRFRIGLTLARIKCATKCSLFFGSTTLNSRNAVHCALLPPTSVLVYFTPPLKSLESTRCKF